MIKYKDAYHREPLLDISYVIPAKLIKGKKGLAVKFQTKQKKKPGRCNYRMVKRAGFNSNYHKETVSLRSDQPLFWFI